MNKSFLFVIMMVAASFTGCIDGDDSEDALTDPVGEDKALNERNYGDLIGQNKAEAAEEFGKEQVQIWRRSYGLICGT